MLNLTCKILLAAGLVLAGGCGDETRSTGADDTGTRGPIDATEDTSGANEGHDAASDDGMDAAATGDGATQPEVATPADATPQPDTLPDHDTAAPEADTAMEPDTAVELDTAVEPDTAIEPDTAVEPDTEAGCRSCSDAHRPVILVHGINGSSAEFATMIDRLETAGWPADRIYPFDAVDAAWGCNVDNAEAIAALADQALTEHPCESRVDVVAHSMGTLSTRYFIKNLGGTDVVNTYVTLGGMHHGLASPCWAPEFLGICVWTELCESGKFVAQLNEAPATPGDLFWVSIYGTADATVPNASSELDGAENIVIEGVEHAGENGLLEREDVWSEIVRVLGYACW